MSSCFPSEFDPLITMSLIASYSIGKSIPSNYGPGYRFILSSVTKFLSRATRRLFWRRGAARRQWMSLAHRMGTVVAFHIFCCYCDVRNNFWPSQKFKTSHVLFSKISILGKGRSSTAIRNGSTQNFEIKVFFGYLAKNLIQGKVPVLKQGRSHGESKEANSACGFLFHARFLPMRLATVSTQVPFSTQGLCLVLRFFCSSLFNFVPQKTHVGPKNICFEMGWTWVAGSTWGFLRRYT